MLRKIWYIVLHVFLLYAINDTIFKLRCVKKCRNTEIFLARIFLYSDWIRRFNTKSPYSVKIQENTGQKKLHNLDTFHAVLMMPTESGILLKSHVTCNFMLKYYITISLHQFTKNLNQIFYLSRTNENLEICVPV